jgi:hypothetical protein
MWFNILPTDLFLNAFIVLNVLSCYRRRIQIRISGWIKQPCCFLGSFLFLICIWSHCDSHFLLLRHVLRVEMDDVFLASLVYCSILFYSELLPFDINEISLQRPWSKQTRSPTLMYSHTENSLRGRFGMTCCVSGLAACRRWRWMSIGFSSPVFELYLLFRGIILNVIYCKCINLWKLCLHVF